MSPQLPWGTVRGRATGVWADGTDEDLNPDLTVLEGLTVTLQPMIPAIVWHGDSGPTTHVPSPVVCQFDDEGYLVSPAQGSSEREVRLLASRHEQIEPSPWDWQLSWSLEEIPSTRFQLEAGQTLDLSSIILSSLAPASPELFHDLLEAAQHLETVLPDVQTARDEAVAARDVAVPAATRAEQARDATLTAATWTLTGPGRPDQPATTAGIITGSEPVGTEYRSTDGAGVGAWAWRLRPSGWEVTDLDTGIRRGEPLNGWAGAVRLMRVGNTVTVIGQGMDPVAATGFTFYELPLGFQPTNRIPVPAYRASGTTLVYARIVGGSCQLDVSDTPSSLRDFAATFITADPVPTTLPPPR